MLREPGGTWGMVIFIVLAAFAGLVAAPVAVPPGMATSPPPDGGLNAFEAGKPAKAAEVNHNFKVLAEGLNALQQENAALKQRLDAFESVISVKDGKVGIGIREPRFTLDVAGTSNISPVSFWYPDGLAGAEGVNIEVGGLLKTTWTVPAGKNLYVTNMYIDARAMRIDGQDFIGRGSGKWEQGMSSPMILGPGRVVSADNYDGEQQNVVRLRGFLATARTEILLGTTPPAGKPWVLTWYDVDRSQWLQAPRVMLSGASGPGGHFTGYVMP